MQHTFHFWKIEYFSYQIFAAIRGFRLLTIIMPRKPIIRSNQNYYHLLARSNNREFFYLPIEVVWDIFLTQLKILQNDFRVKIAAFVLMNNHFHLLMLTPNEDIDKVMYFLMKRSTQVIQKVSGRINKIFGGRYCGSIITNYSYLANVYKYILLNPVKANITERAEYYPYSTFYYQHRSLRHLPIILEKIIPGHAFENYEDLNEIEWINSNYNASETVSIQSGLKKSTFDFSKDRASGKRIIPVVRHPKKKTQDELWNLLYNETRDGDTPFT
jgi:putative transposase